MDQGEPMRTIKATIRLAIPGKKRKEVVTVLRSLVEETALHQGCLSCRLYQDVQEHRWLMVEQLWASQEDLERHVRSDRFLSVLLLMEMSAEAPAVRFESIAHCSGMDTIQKIRGERGSPTGAAWCVSSQAGQDVKHSLAQPRRSAPHPPWVTSADGGARGGNR
jgi:quinol monooxygenase YgiN